MLIENDNITAAEFDALLGAANERTQQRIQSLEMEADSKEHEIEQLRKDNEILRQVLQRRRKLADRLSKVLEQARKEQRVLKRKVDRVLARH